MKKLLFVVALATTSIAFAQKKSSPLSFAKTISAGDLKKHLYIIAAPDMEGRETATDGQRKAASYIEQQFRSLGLQPGSNASYQMGFPVYRDSVLSTQLKTNDKLWALNQDFQPMTYWQPNSATSYFSNVIVVGHGIVDSAYDDYSGLDVRGKLVMILEGVPQGFKSSKTGLMSPASTLGKLIAAREKGAAAVLMFASNFPRRVMPALGNMYVDLYRDIQSPNIFMISEKVAEAIIGTDWNGMKEKSKKEKVPAKEYTANIFLEYQKKVQFLESTNVLGFLEGTDKKDELVVITAHYDHLGKRDTAIYYGADDDGSGTVAVIEIAEAFVKAKAAGKGPRRSILFMTVSGEEKGLWGSKYYVENPEFKLDKTTVNLNIDMIGRIDPNRKKGDSSNYVYVVGDDKISSDLKPVSESTNKMFTKLELDYKFNDPDDPERIYYRSDHYNFARMGVPIIFYFDGIHKDYHRTSDTPDKINYDLLQKRTQLVFYTAWEMANRETMLKRDRPLQKREF
jgi:Peptidase family M28